MLYNKGGREISRKPQSVGGILIVSDGGELGLGLNRERKCIIQVNPSSFECSYIL